MAADLYLKLGASLQLLIAATNDDGTVFDLTGVAVSAQVRTDASALIATLSVTPTGIPGQLSVLQATDGWPVGKLYCDFKFASASGVVVKTPTVALIVTAAITQ